MSKRFAAALVLALCALPAASAADRAVTIASTGFTPPDVTIAAHDSVTWRNTDTKAHRVVFDKAPCNLTVQPGASGSCVFHGGGKFNYRDPGQANNFRGSVTVTGPKNSVTLSSPKPTAPFAAPLTLSGVVSSQQTGETVSLSAQECGKTTFTQLGTATTTAGGAWSFIVKPALNTVYRARWHGTDSPATTVKVSPKLKLTRSRGRFTVRVTAAQAFTGKLVYLQRYRPAVKRWATVKRVKLGGAKAPAAGTMVTSASFRSRVRRGWRVRALLTQAQAGTCYAPGTSNTLRIL
jgi:plastocyanin